MVTGEGHPGRAAPRPVPDLRIDVAQTAPIGPPVTATATALNISPSTVDSAAFACQKIETAERVTLLPGC